MLWPQAYFETNDAAEPPAWIELRLPANVQVTRLTRYTFAHGHRRPGYFRLRSWRTFVTDTAGPSASPLAELVRRMPASAHRHDLKWTLILCRGVAACRSCDAVMVVRCTYTTMLPTSSPRGLAACRLRTSQP